MYGTQFNVFDCEKTQESEVILKEGSVSVLINNQEELKLQPGQRFFLNDKKKYTVTTVDPDLYLSWKDNVLRINKEKLQDLIIRMERWYGINIRIEDFEQVKDLRYTLTIKTESLREMLRFNADCDTVSLRNKWRKCDFEILLIVFVRPMMINF